MSVIAKPVTYLEVALVSFSERIAWVEGQIAQATPYSTVWHLLHCDLAVLRSQRASCVKLITAEGGEVAS